MLPARHDDDYEQNCKLNLLRKNSVSFVLLLLLLLFEKIQFHKFLVGSGGLSIKNVHFYVFLLIFLILVYKFVK